MSGPARAGVLVYAKDLQQMSTFYERVLDAVVLQSADILQLRECLP